MEKRLHELEQKVDDLSRVVEQLRARLDALPQAQGFLAPLPDAPLKPLDVAAPQPVVPLVGRSLLVVAGAFVFRLLTEREILPRAVGVCLGLLFATLWLFFAARDGKKGARLSAAFHAGAGSLIGFSLLLETGSKTELVPPAVTAAVLAAFAALVLATAWRLRLQEIAWLGQLGALVTAVELMRRLEGPLPFLLVLWALAAASLVLAEGRAWPHLRWPVALVLDAAALRLVFSLAAIGDDQPSPYLVPVVIVVQATVVLYVGSLAMGTWLRRRPVRAFEVAQTVLVLSVGLGAMARGHFAAWPWGLLTAVGALATAVHLATAEARAFDSWFYGALGVVLTLVSAPLLLSGAALGLFWAVVALALAGLGRWRLTHLLWGAAALLAWAAASPGGALGLMMSALVRAPDAEWPALTAAAAATVGVAFGAWALMTVGAKGHQDPASRLAAAALLGLGVLGAAALGSDLVREALGGASANGAVVVLTRTVLLCGAAVALAAARRLSLVAELDWLAWGLLVLGGLKVLAQDLPRGNAATLVGAFLVLGLAIIAVPRLLKARGAAAS